MKTTRSAKKKRFAQALGITAAAVLGVLANAGTAAADGRHIEDPDAPWEDPDGAEVREMSWAPADSYDTSSDVLGANTPVVLPGGPGKPAGRVLPGGPVLAWARVGRCGQLTVAT